jgi:hypothetical protein
LSLAALGGWSSGSIMAGVENAADLIGSLSDGVANCPRPPRRVQELQGVIVSTRRSAGSRDEEHRGPEIIDATMQRRKGTGRALGGTVARNHKEVRMRSLILAGVFTAGFAFADSSPTMSAPTSALGQLAETGSLTITVQSSKVQPGMRCSCRCIGWHHRWHTQRRCRWARLHCCHQGRSGYCVWRGGCRR